MHQPKIGSKQSNATETNNIFFNLMKSTYFDCRNEPPKVTGRFELSYAVQSGCAGFYGK